jgi:hypothetical protein
MKTSSSCVVVPSTMFHLGVASSGTNIVKLNVKKIVNYNPRRNLEGELFSSSPVLTTYTNFCKKYYHLNQYYCNVNEFVIFTRSQ